MTPCRVCAIGGGVVSTISVGWAWATSVDVGTTATKITVLGGAICGVVALVITTVVGAWSKAKAEAWATQERIRIQVRQEEERQNAESYTAQIKKLTVTIEEGNKTLLRVTEEGNARVEDANAKLHEARKTAQADALERANQIRELREELTAAREETRQARQEVHQLHIDNRDFHAENRRLLAEVAGLKARTNAQGRDIADNRQKIDDTKAAVAEIAKAADPMPPTGESPPVPFTEHHRMSTGPKKIPTPTPPDP